MKKKESDEERRDRIIREAQEAGEHYQATYDEEEDMTVYLEVTFTPDFLPNNKLELKEDFHVFHLNDDNTYRINKKDDSD